MFLSEPYPNFTGTFPNYDPTQLNNQGVGTVLTGDEAKRERYNNYNVTLRRQLPANFSATVAYIGAYGTRSAVRQRDQPHPVRRNRRSTATCCSATCRAQPQLGIPLPYPGFTGTVQQALRPYPQFTSVQYLNNFKGKTRYDSLQTTVERHFRNDFARARRLYLVQDARQRAHAGRVG